MWYSIFNKKEVNEMPEVSKKTVDNLTKQVTVCNEQIASLRSRISQLVDENKVLETLWLKGFVGISVFLCSLAPSVFF